ncbi:hypothetical protein [Ascidiimonas aurantiaca]|uniref:hypothetical protein n=1 Tax=Ascidiimonas aurantiaca TaxID=1685432 RepID=UPI0030EC5CBE
MKKFFSSIVIIFAFVASLSAQEKVSLKQTEGEFTQKEVRLAPGNYVFEVTNEGVDRKVGFVLAPKGKTDQKYHIKNAYLQKTIANGETATSKEVLLKKGEYVYFCPLNPTPQYTLLVE